MSSDIKQTLVDESNQNNEENNIVEVPNSTTDLILDESDKSTGFQFSANLIKSITGSTPLIFPYIFWKMGLLTGLSMTIFIVYIFSACALRILEVRKAFLKEKIDESDPLYHIDNDYTIFCYHYFGKFGYWLMIVCTLITLWGSDMGTIVLMTDFLADIPPFNHISTNKYLVRLLPTLILFVLCWLTCILKNPTLLAGISSFGLLALIIAFIVVLIDGGIRFGLSFDISILYPQSWMGILSNIGIIINSFGFLLILLPLYNNLKVHYKPKIFSLVNFSMISLALTYIITGIFLFLMYRSDPQQIQEAILFNLKKDSPEFILVSLMMVITMIGSFPLLLLPCFEILEADKEKKENCLFVTDSYRFYSRTIQVIVITVLGFFIPEFSSINSISVVVSQLIPTVLHYVAVGKKQGGWKAIEDWIIFVLFIGVMFICTGCSVLDLINKLKN